MIFNPILKKTVVNGIETGSVDVELDMKDGDQIILPKGENTLIDKATVKKPATMTPENIRSGREIGGVVGSYETPTEELSVTENGEYVPSAGKHFSVVTVNVEATGSGDGTSEDLTAELTEQDELLTAIESLLNGSSDEGGDSGDSGDSGSGGGASGGSATLTVTFGYEMEEENEEGDYEMVIHEPYSAVGYYTVDGGEAEYFDGEEEISIDASIGSVVEISVSDIYGMSGEFNTTNEVGCVGAFLSEEGGEFGGCPDGVQITITESDASVTVYECYA